MALDQASVLQALTAVVDPDIKKDLVSMGLIRDVQVDGDAVALKLLLLTPVDPLVDSFKEQITTILKDLGATHVDITVSTVPKDPPKSDVGGLNALRPRMTQQDRMSGVRTVIAVAAGKGGVGKSTVASNLAIALSRLGATVGLLDADIYGPSVPIMLGLRKARPGMTADEKIAPMQRYGLSVMSMGFMLREDQAVAWRGPMLGKALQQFIEDVAWGSLDYVILDMPPGTGDIQLSLAQLLPVAGTLIVTTPQDVAFADVKRAINQLEMTKTPVLGIVENMSTFICGQCDAEHAIFGESRTAAHAEELGLEMMGKIPLDSVTAHAADQGEPITVAQPDSAAAHTYRDIAQRVARKAAVSTYLKTQTDPKFASFFGSTPTTGEGGAPEPQRLKVPDRG